MSHPAVIVAKLTALAVVVTLAAGARRPTRCLGGAEQLTICVETPPGAMEPRRYDNGGLYGPEFWRRRYGLGASGPPIGAPPIAPPNYAIRYDYRVHTKPLYDQPSSDYSPGPPGFSPPPGYSPGPPAYRPPPPPYSPGPPPYSPGSPAYSPGFPAYRPDLPVYRPLPLPVYRPEPPPIFRPSPPISVEYGYDRQPSYATPPEHASRTDYAGRTDYVGGFRPMIVQSRPYHHEEHQSTAPEPRPFVIRPHVSGPQYPPHADIRSFYRGASMLGQGQISLDGRNNVQFVCDFSLAGVNPDTDVLTDVVWQKVGRPAYMNNPMTSVSSYPNLLSCPNNYVSSAPTNYGFNIAGSKTTLVIKNATSADYGMYRCYATRVSRSTPRRRTPVYMEVYYSPSGTSRRR